MVFNLFPLYTNLLSLNEATKNLNARYKNEKGNENYYKALEKLTGITKANYNEKIWELIKNEK